MKLPALKWWQWALIAVLGIGAIGAMLPDPTTSEKAPTEKQAANTEKQASQASSFQIPDPCNREVALANVEIAMERTNGALSYSLSGSELRIIATPATWAALGPNGQTGVIAMFDCAAAGPGQYMSELTVAPGLGMEPFARFDAIALGNARKSEPASIKVSLAE